MHILARYEVSLIKAVTGRAVADANDTDVADTNDNTT